VDVAAQSGFRGDHLRRQPSPDNANHGVGIRVTAPMGVPSQPDTSAPVRCG
jgi:hypothetical protein